MRDAAIERLSKIVSDNTRSNQGPEKRFRSLIELKLKPDEGWFLFGLLAIVVYSTIWCICAIGWVDHLGYLFWTTAFGLLVGLFATQQYKLPRIFMHGVIVVFSILLGYWLTALVSYNGSTIAFWNNIQSWMSTAINGGVTDDDSIFLFFIIALSFLLAYTSTWLVLRTRSPWLMIVANVVVILINLDNATDGFIIFLVLFLIASLLLLLRFNLYESICRWKRQGLRYAEDIGWDVMQAGALISIGILIFSWILPGNVKNTTFAQVWTLNPLVQFQNTLDRVVGVSGGATVPSPGAFRGQLVLGGNPNLANTVVFTATTDDPNQYYATLSYDTYNGRGWTNNGGAETQDINQNTPLSSGALSTHTVKQTIRIAQPPIEQDPYLIGIPDIASVSIPAKLLWADANGVIAWEGRGALNTGMTYTVVSNVSAADTDTLRSVPMPQDAPKLSTGAIPDHEDTIQPNVYNPTVLRQNTTIPKNLDPRIAKLALKVTANQKTMYDKMVALENYLRTNYAYSLDIRPPAGVEPVSWFLFGPDKKGFCNYYASAMSIMARTLGIPARVVVGYTNGHVDPKTNQRVVMGTDAHAWTQIYFAGYGWVNFEPSGGQFKPFERPKPHEFQAGTLPGSINTGSDINTLKKNLKQHGTDPEGAFTDSGTTTTQGPQIQQQIAFGFGSLVLLGLFGILLFALWWQRIFKHYSPAVQIYGRLCLLANWAGIKVQPSQTPFEYIQEVSVVAPDDKPMLERLSDIYVRDRWANPESDEHPLRSGEINELSTMWKKLQPRFFLYMLRHPYFLFSLPTKLWRTGLSAWRKRKGKRRFMRGEL